MIVEKPLFGLGLQGKSPDVSANKLVNAYYEFHLDDKDRTEVSIHGTPGLTLFLDRGDTPWRGLWPVGDTLYGVHRGTFYSINNAGIATSRGTIGTTSGRVDITDDGTYVVVVDGSEIYTYDTSTPATPIAAVSDADRPTSPNTCIFQGGRVLTDEDGTGQFKGGDAYDPTSWNALNYATAESNPDNLVRVINYRGIVTLLGEYTTEFWANVGGAGFPYTRILNGDLEYGLAARWSAAKFAGSYAFLAKNREGEVNVSMLEGYGIRKISNTELDHVINGYSTVSDATGIGYTLGGHPMYQINFPTAGKSWMYDFTTKYWSELRYSTNERHRSEIGVEYLNRTIVSDYSNGKLYILDPDALDDNGDSIIMELTGRHIHNKKQNVRIAALELGIESGVGVATGQGSDPVAALQLSKDSGHTFGTIIYAKMGATGEYTKRCRWRRLGVGRDIVPRITISDPVKRVITDSTLFLDSE